MGTSGAATERSDGRPPHVVVVGSYGVGLTLTTDRVPDAGETVIGRSFSTGHGGKGSNQAVAARRLGARVTLLSQVGTDTFGGDARGLWTAEGVDHRLVRTAPGSTMVGVILVDATGENRIAIAPGVLSEFGPEHLGGLDAALADADALLVGLEIPLETAAAALQAGRRAGVTTVLNPAPAPPEPLPHHVLALVDHLVPNRTEAARLTGIAADSDASALLHGAGLASVDTVVLTLGGDGALVRTAGATTALAAHPVATVVDTTGAGDTFSAAYTVRLAAGDHPVPAARFATRAAAHCVGIAEVVPSLPYWSDLTGETHAASRDGDRCPDDRSPAGYRLSLTAGDRSVP